MCVEKTEIRTKKTGKRLSSPSSPAQTVCYVGNPESDDNCRQSLTFDKKIPHKVCQLLHNRDILGSQILGQISALMRCVKLKAKRQKNKNMTKVCISRSAFKVHISPHHRHVRI